MSEELKPIRMDGKYQTRDGLAVRLLCVDRKSENYPVVALVTDDDGTEIGNTYTQYGYFTSDKANHPRDLIEVDEQVSYVNIYPHMAALHSQLETAEAKATGDRTATLKITHINGKFASVEPVKDATLAKARGEA